MHNIESPCLLIRSTKRVTHFTSEVWYFVSSHEHIEILTVNGELLFFRQRDGPFYPTLRLLHKCKMAFIFIRCFPCRKYCLRFQKIAYITQVSLTVRLMPGTHICSPDPFILPHQQVDKGAIKFVLSGANIMCPGLTSPGAKLYPAETDKVVVSFQLLYYF